MPNSTNSETQYTPTEHPFSQGDIISLPNRPLPPHLGVIINADCDLLHNKTDGVYSYLPIYTFKEYLETFWMHDKIDEFRNQLLQKILRSIEQPKSSLTALESWISSSDYTTIIQNLREELSLSKKCCTNLALYVRQYVDAFKLSKTPTESLQCICNFQNDPRRYLNRQLKDAYKNLSHGHLFVNEIFGIRELGFVIRLRRIYSISQKNFFKSETELRISSISESRCAIRIAQLSPQFQYKLLQLFANQFSRIGLPDEFAELHELIIDEASAQLLRKIP